MKDLSESSTPLAGTLSNLLVPLSHNVVGGIGVGVTSSVDGLLLLCEPYKHMREADIIAIYLYEPGGGRDPILIHPLSAEEVNNNVTFIVPPEKIRSGWFELYYTATHTDSGVSNSSPIVNLWIKLDVPGGIDPKPQTQNINENFHIPELPVTIIYNGVDAEQARQGVAVTIRPYENMRVRDKVNLSWGGRIISHTVAQEEVNKSLTLVVDEESILKAGDSDLLLVTYEVRDEVNNYSRWSPDQAISVDVSGNRLPAPIVKEAASGIIDLDKLNKQSITIQVWASSGDFKINDSVWLQLSGRNSAGDVVYREAYLPVVFLPSTIEFFIAYEDIAAFTQGYFIASYILRKSADDSRIASRKTTVTVKGALPGQLPAPEIVEAVGTNLDGSLDFATVIIHPFTSMAQGTEILLFWRGVTPNGDSYNHILPVAVETTANALSVVINRNAIQALAGGTVSIYYQFTSAEGVVFISSKTNLNIIELLAAPAIANSINDVLDPDNITSGVIITIPPWLSMAEGDRIDLHWKAVSAAGSAYDWLKIAAIAVGKSVKFFVSKEYIDKSINSTVDVYYQVTQGSGMTLTSASVLLRIRYTTHNDLEKLIIEQAVDNVLNVSNLRSDVELRVPAYNNMLNGDVIDVYLDGEVSWHDIRQVTASMKGSDVLFMLPLAFVSANSGKKITLYYKVKGTDVGNSTSPDLVINVVSTVALLPAPTVDEASNGLLDPDALSLYAKLRITPYTNMAVGDTVTAFLTGLVEWQDYWPVSGGGVNRDVSLYIPKDIIIANNHSTIYLSYQVSHASGVLSSSKRMALQVKTAGIILPAPQVQGAVGGVLDYTLLPAEGATVTVPAWDAMTAGDGVTLFWGPAWTQYLPVSGNLAGRDITFIIPLTAIESLAEKNITVSYEVTQWNGTVNRSQLLTLYIPGDSLPAPYVKQATGGDINVGTVTAGANVIIPLSARLRAGDNVEIIWKSALSPDKTVFTRLIFSSDVGIDYQFVIPADTVLLAAGGEVTLYYTIQRNGQRYESPSIQYSVTHDLVNGDIIVLGARSSMGNFGASAKSRHLTALDRRSGWLTTVTWQYDGEDSTVTATRFLDIKPWKKIKVSSASETITVRPLNIIGNGDDEADDRQAAMVARLDTGKIVAWGSVACGGKLPIALTGIEHIQEICGSSGALVARLRDSSVVPWGDAARGGAVTSAVEKLTNVVSLSSTSRAFAALLSTGKVVAWGDKSAGGTVTQDIAAFNNIVKVVGSGGAFVALRANRRVAAWGSSKFGGRLTTEIIGLTTVKDIACNYAAFVALTSGNTLASWGSSEHGGNLPSGIKSLKDVSEIMATTSCAFVVKRANGLLATWGADAYGGTLPDDFSSITDVVEVVATSSAFIALRNDGRVISWGNKDAGGVLPREIAQLNDIVQIATTASACAVLRANGTVMAWGALSAGGNITPVTNKLMNCRALYSSTGAFAAITSDDRVIVWGNDRCGADNSAVSNDINGLISYEER